MRDSDTRTSSVHADGGPAGRCAAATGGSRVEPGAMSDHALGVGRRRGAANVPTYVYRGSLLRHPPVGDLQDPSRSRPELALAPSYAQPIKAESGRSLWHSGYGNGESVRSSLARAASSVDNGNIRSLHRSSREGQSLGGIRPSSSGRSRPSSSRLEKSISDKQEKHQGRILVDPSEYDRQAEGLLSAGRVERLQPSRPSGSGLVERQQVSRPWSGRFGRNAKKRPDSARGRGVLSEEFAAGAHSSTEISAGGAVRLALEGSLLTDGEDDGMDSDDGDLEEEMPEGENFGRDDAEEGDSDMLSDDESAPASVVDAEELMDTHQRYWKLLREEERTGWQDPNVRKLLNPSLFVGRPPSVIYHNDWATGVPSFDESPLHEVEDEGAGEEIEGEQKPRPKKARSLTVKVLSEKPKSAQLWLFHKKLLTFKVGYKTTMVRKSHWCAGITETRGSLANSYWGMAFSRSVYARVKVFQRVNHFPGTFELGRKDRLLRGVQKMRRRLHSVLDPTTNQRLSRQVDFIPETFLLPKEFDAWKAAFKASSAAWIWKPNASARGIGIRLVTKLDQVPHRKDTDEIKPGLIQRYIANPLLLNGAKCDLRLYVVATCYNPLRLYIYPEGLVRISTKKYVAKSAKKGSSQRARFMHLTNYSVNKHSKSFVGNTSVDEQNVGNKWSVTALWQHLRSGGLPEEEITAVWSRIQNVVRKAFITADGSINNFLWSCCPHPNNCYELFGVDILLDDKLKPWLLEINTSPDTSPSSPMDKRIKSTMLTSLFTMLRFHVVDKKAMMRSAEEDGDTRQQQASKRHLASALCPLLPPSVLALMDQRRPTTGRITSARFSGGSSGGGSKEVPWWASLTEAELEMLKTSGDEMACRGPWQCLLPCPHDTSFLQMFEVPRPNNHALFEFSKCQVDNVPQELAQALGMRGWQGLTPYYPPNCREWANARPSLRVVVSAQGTRPLPPGDLMRPPPPRGELVGVYERIEKLQQSNTRYSAGRGSSRENGGGGEGLIEQRTHGMGLQRRSSLDSLSSLSSLASTEVSEDFVGGDEPTDNDDPYNSSAPPSPPCPPPERCDYLPTKRASRDSEEGNPSHDLDVEREASSKPNWERQDRARAIEEMEIRLGLVSFGRPVATPTSPLAKDGSQRTSFQVYLSSRQRVEHSAVQLKHAATGNPLDPDLPSKKPPPSVLSVGGRESMTRLEKYDYLSTSYGRSAYTVATAHTGALPANASSVGGGGVDIGMYTPTPGSTVSLSNIKYCGTELRVLSMAHSKPVQQSGTTGTTNIPPRPSLRMMGREAATKMIIAASRKRGSGHKEG